MKFKLVIILIVLSFGIYQTSKRNVWFQDTKELNAIKAELDEGLVNSACVSEGPFPFSTLEGRESKSSGKASQGCDKCEQLHKAGLLSKEVIEHNVPPSEENPEGRVVFEVLYDLTDLGKTIYIKGTTDNPNSKDSHRFCLGRKRVQKFTRIVGPKSMAGTTYLTVRYIAVLENATSYISDPRAQFLGIPIPAGNPPIYQENYTTAVFEPGSDKFHLDRSVQILF